MKKRGNTLVMNQVIEIIVNVLYVFILITFIISRISSSSVYEEKYAKEIALALDSAKPGMIITINMQDAVRQAEKNLGKGNIGNIVQINGNVVTVKLTDKKGYSYSFFNNLNMSKPLSNYYLDPSDDSYVFFIGGYNEQKGK